MLERLEEYEMDQTFNWHDAVTNKWDSNATNWNERSKQMWEDGSRKTIIPFMEEYVRIGSDVLDVGCGSGYGTYRLHQAGYHVTGVDISGEMIQLANKYYETLGITFSQADVNELPLQANAFDAIMSINVLEWTKVPVVALAELSRILKKGGLLCVGILGPTAGPRANSYRRLYDEGVILNTMMPWEFLQLAKEQGYKLVDQQPVWKREMNNMGVETLSVMMQQALSFMWLFMLQKNGTK